MKIDTRDIQRHVKRGKGREWGIVLSLRVLYVSYILLDDKNKMRFLILSSHFTRDFPTRFRKKIRTGDSTHFIYSPKFVDFATYPNSLNDLFATKWKFSRGRQLKFATFTFFLRALTYLLISTLDFLFLSFWPFGLSYFLIFSPTLLYIHNLFVPFTFLGNQRDIKYRSITFPPLVPAANIDMSPLLTFYFHSHSYLSLFLTRKKIFLLLSFSLISYLFLSFSTLFFLPLSFSFLFYLFLAPEQKR